MASISSQPPSRTDLNEQYRAQQAEKEEVRDQNETEIENLKKAYNAQKQDLKDRFEASAIAEKNATYENLRNMKSQLNRDERQMDAMQKELIGQKSANFTKEALDTEREGRTKVSNLRQQYVSAEETERNKLLEAEQLIRTDHKKSAEWLINNSQKKVEALRQEKEAFLENQKLTHAEALNQIEGHYHGIRADQLKAYQGEMQNVANQVGNDLDQRKLAALTYVKKHDTKQADPFYQLKRFDSDLLDIGDAYMLRVKVPEYERKQFRVQVSGQDIQLSGVRSSDETVQLEPGRSISTKSYQNISERYNLDSPVDGRSLTMKPEGDWLVYTLPKFGINHRVSDQYKGQSYREKEPIGKELDFVNTLPKPEVPVATKSKGPMNGSST